MKDHLLTQLPEEVIRCILSQCGPQEAKALRGVCKDLYKLVTSHLEELEPKSFPESRRLLATFPRLKKISFKKCADQVDDKMLLQWLVKDKPQQVEKLDLSNCCGITNRGVGFVCRNMPYLQELNLSGCRNPMPVGGIGLEGLDASTVHHLPQLTSLSLAWNPVTDESLAIVALLPKLEKLDLSNCPYVSHSGLLQLVQMRFIKELKLANTCITDQSLAVIASSFRDTLEVLDISGCLAISNVGIVSLCDLTALKSLSLAGCRFLTASCTPYLGVLTTLQSLDLSRTLWVGPPALHALAGLPQLHNLLLQECLTVDDGVWASIQALYSLRVLDLTKCYGVQGVNIDLIAGLDLKELVLSYTGLTDQGMGQVLGISQLEKLDVSYCQQLSPAALASIGRLSALRHLFLSYCRQVTDEVLLTIPSLPSLQTLSLKGCPAISDVAVRQIPICFPHLRELDLSWCYHVTDVGLECVRSGLADLNRIDLVGCQSISDGGRQKLFYLEGNKMRSVRSRSYQRFVDTCAS